MTGRTVVAVRITDYRRQGVRCMTCRCTVRKDRQHISILRHVLMIFGVMRTVKVTIIVVSTAVTVRTRSSTTGRVTVTCASLQLTVGARIRMAQSTRAVMCITYNVSATRSVMAVRCTRRSVGYVRVIAAIMVLEVAGVVR
jgi:hypothetical protein